MPDIPESIIAGAAMGGGQTQEHIQYNVETQVLVPILHAVALVPCTGAIIGGLVLLGAGIVDLARMCQTGWDLLLFAIVIVLGLAAFAGLALAVTGKVVDEPPRWAPLAAYLGAVVWVTGLLNIVRIADGNWQWHDNLRLLAGLVLPIAGLLLTYRLVNELWNPLYPPSPTTKMLNRYIDAQLAAQEPEKVMVRRPIPINAGNHRAELDWQREAEPESQMARETGIDEDFVDLVALVKRAAVVGWARNQHVKRVNLRMPSGRLLTRPLFVKLVYLAAEPWRIIAKLGKGQSPEWLMDPDAAVFMLERVYAAQFGPDGEVLPIDDPGQDIRE